MEFCDLIIKKRDGGELTESEIAYFVRGASDDSIPDYQLSAFLMATVWRGMTEREVALLTMAMARSGDTVDLSALPHTVDKHSTGGVGDKTSLIVGPIAAACGCTVAKMSGRGLGHTGGTVDKLESVPGVKTEFSREDFLKQAREIKLVIAGQSGDLAPADKKLYALRDVTGTVESLPLIVSSIMSKKLAAGADSILLDVKTGSGAFMKTPSESEALAKAMVSIGRACGKKIDAVISDMSVPLGNSIGNALEVEEAIQVLCGNGPSDLRELCLTLASGMVRLALEVSEEKARRMVQRALDGGFAAEYFGRFMMAQGAVADPIAHPQILSKAKYCIPVTAIEDGYIMALDALVCGNVALRLGAGRKTKADRIDPAAGIVLQKKPGAYVCKGDLLATLHTNKVADPSWLLPAFKIGKEQPDVSPIIYKTSF